MTVTRSRVPGVCLRQDSAWLGLSLAYTLPATAAAVAAGPAPAALAGRMHETLILPS